MLVCEEVVFLRVDADRDVFLVGDGDGVADKFFGEHTFIIILQDDAVDEHTFREDLYYRLAVVTLELPPLRKRPMEIPLLAEKFVREFARENQRGELKIAPELMKKLQAHPWPGNIRELRNCLESMVVLSSGDTLTVDDLPPRFDDTPELPAEASKDAPSESGGTLESSERELIAKALEHNHGNITRAAQELGISRRTLHRRLAKK